jgi:hypothetical protein
MKPYLFIFFLLCLFIIAKSQTSISGRITDSNNQPLSFVSVILLQDSLLLWGSVTDETGSFQVPYSYKQGTTYHFKFSLVGYRPLIKKFVYPDSGFIRIVLQEAKNGLGEVTVTAKKPLVVRKTDRYVVNVENSFLANGNSGLEVLQKSPGIWVDKNGGIRIKGGQPVMVMINDAVQHLTEEELIEYLKTIKSEEISKIEIIHNPPSEFEAAGTGGIIHIVLKKGRKDGLNGSVSGQYRQQGKKPYMTTGGSLDYKLKNLYLSGSYSLTKDIKSIIETSNIDYTDQTHYSGFTSRTDNAWRQYYRLGLACDLHRNQSVGIQNSGSYIHFIQPFITDINYKNASQSFIGTGCTDRVRKVNFSSTTINYLWKPDSLGSMLKFIADYTNSRKTEYNNFYEVYNDSLQNSVYRNQVPSAIEIKSIQADFIKVRENKMEIKNGIKYASIKRDGEIVYEDYINNTWIGSPGKNSHFIYNESLLMGYFSVEKSINKTNIKVGLRAEETFSKGNSVNSNQRFYKTYFGLFPSLFIMQTLNEQKGDAAYLNYSRRLQRPGLSDLNPDRTQFNNNTASTGNPELLPPYSHNLELGYKFLNDYSADIYLISTTNVIALWANPGPNNFIEYQSRNFSNSTECGFACNAPFKITKGWSANNNFSLYHLSYRNSSFAINQMSFSVRSIHNITLKNVMEIDAVADYRSAYVYSNLQVPQVFYIDVGVSKKIMSNKAYLRLNITDVLNTLQENEITDFHNAHIVFYRKRPTRTFSLLFAYNFSSGKKFDNRKISQSNNDERNRIGN